MRPVNKLKSILAAVTALWFSAAGCRAPAAPDAGFIDNPSQLKVNAKLPFDAVWFQDGVDLRRYSKVYVAPIDTSHLLKLDWWDRANFAPGTEQSQADNLAKYFQDHVIQSFKTDSKKAYTVVDAPDAETLLVELAIVEVIPTKEWLNVIGYLAVGALSSGTTAFEGRLRDGKTKQLVAQFKDQENGQFDLVSISDLTWFRHSEHTIRMWSDQIAQVCYRAPEETIKPMSTVTLRPW